MGWTASGDIVMEWLREEKNPPRFGSLAYWHTAENGQVTFVASKDMLVKRRDFVHSERRAAKLDFTVVSGGEGKDGEEQERSVIATPEPRSLQPLITPQCVSIPRFHMPETANLDTRNVENRKLHDPSSVLVVTVTFLISAISPAT